MKPKIATATVPPASRAGATSGEVIEVIVVAVNGTNPAAALGESERAELEQCEGIIQRGLGTFYEVGSALLRIRESRLYRALNPSFEDYCQKRWNIGRSYTSRVMGAAERLQLLPGDDPMPRPANEFQMRPFLELAPEVFPGAWKRVVKTARGGKVTTRIVRAVIRDLLPNNPGGEKKKRRKKKMPVGQCLAMLNEAKRFVEKGEKDKALEALERVESLLVKA